MLYLDRIQKRQSAKYYMLAQIYMNQYSNKPEVLLETLGRMAGAITEDNEFERDKLSRLKTKLGKGGIIKVT